MLSGIYCGNIQTANKRPKAFSGIGSKKRNTVRPIKIRATQAQSQLSSKYIVACFGQNHKLIIKRTKKNRY